MSEGRRDFYDHYGNYMGYTQPHTSSFSDIEPRFAIGMTVFIALLLALPIGLIGGLDSALIFLFWYGNFVGFFGGIFALFFWGIGTISEKASNRKRS